MLIFLKSGRLLPSGNHRVTLEAAAVGLSVLRVSVFTPDAVINTAANDLLRGVNRNRRGGECGQLSGIQRIN